MVASGAGATGPGPGEFAQFSAWAGNWWEPQAPAGAIQERGRDSRLSKRGKMLGWPAKLTLDSDHEDETGETDRESSEFS